MMQYIKDSHPQEKYYCQKVMRIDQDRWVEIYWGIVSSSQNAWYVRKEADEKTGFLFPVIVRVVLIWIY